MDGISIPMSWLGLGVFLIMFLCMWYFMPKRSRDPLLPNEEVGHLAGLTRDALEDLALEATKWKCGVCAFHNSKDKTTCQLCKTAQAVYILEAPELFQTMEGTLRPEQLSLDQQSARLRHQWKLNVIGNTWKWQATMPIDSSSTYYVATAKPQWSLLPMARANVNFTLCGEILPLWWHSLLDQMRQQPFSLKYARLVSYIAATYTGHTKFNVARHTVLNQSLTAITDLQPSELCTLTTITLEGESGIDAGGIMREWYTILVLAIFEPKQGLFVANKADQSFSINPNSKKAHGPSHLEKFHSIGRLLGRAIVDGQVLPFHLSIPLFKMLLGYPVSMDDIQYIDLTVYSSLKFIQGAADVDSLTLTFSVSLDASTEVDLIPNGRNVAVTNANKADYVDRMVRYLLFGSVAPQLESLVQGLYEVLPPELLMAFDYKELELVLCGFSEIDVADWKRCTNVSRSLESIVEWFWEIVENEMTSVQRERLLQFTTGSSRVPLQGFKGLTSQDGRLCPFSLHGMSYKEGILPRVQSCFNRINMPIYPTKELMREGIFALVNIESMIFTLV
ncbi:unnamed protein product [Aphanomyces euteiches]